MSLKRADLTWLNQIERDLKDFAYQLNGKKSQCDSCSLNKWDNKLEGQVQIAAQSTITKVARLRALIEKELTTS